jgi:hypothetical protein
MSVPNQILVSGSSTSYVNGVYDKSETAGLQGSPIYNHTTAWVPPQGSSGPGMEYLAPIIRLEAGGPTRFWRFYFAAPAPWDPLLILQYSGTSNQVVPSETWPGEWPGDNTTDPVIAWDGQPGLTITAYSPTPQGSGNGVGEEGNFTFGLPPDVVGLINKNFGTVANYLRLRNQGQI